MNHITELFISKALAQGVFNGSGNSGVTPNSFTLDKFIFLKPFSNTEAGFFSTVLTRIIGITLTFAALAAFFYLIFAGFQYITAGGDAAKATAARTGIVNSLIGIIVILVAYVVLRYVGSSLLGNGAAG